MREADGLRNRLVVHGYNELNDATAIMKLNDALAVASIQNLLSPLERFVGRVTAWVKRSA